MINLDFKKLGCIDWKFLHVWVDDHSRVAYTELLFDEEATTCIGFLLRAGAWLKGHGVKLNLVMTDNGNAYRSHLLNTARRALGAKPIKTIPYITRTNGKAERFIQTSLKEWGPMPRHAKPQPRERLSSSPGWITQHTAPTYRLTDCEQRPC